jgi:hypothetical protein
MPPVAPKTRGEGETLVMVGCGGTVPATVWKKPEDSQSCSLHACMEMGKLSVPVVVAFPTATPLTRPALTV